MDNPTLVWHAHLTLSVKVLIMGIIIVTTEDVSNALQVGNVILRFVKQRCALLASQMISAPAFRLKEH